MPWAPKHPCAQQGCPKLTDKRYCDDHKPKRDAAAKAAARLRWQDHEDAHPRESFDKRYGPNWRRARLMHLHEHPLCVECEREGLVVGGTIVDHIVGIQDGGSILDPDNLQTMCDRHHREKTQRELTARRRMRRG